jgi:SNF2 family DNA or RNA helicase
MILIEEKQTKKLPGITSLFISFSYNPEIVNILKSTDTHHYDTKNKVWEVGLNNLSLLLDSLCQIDDIELKLLKEKTKEQEKENKLHKYKTKPFEYQEKGIQFGLNHNKWLLLDAPGLGKSLQIIYLAQELKQKYDIKHCLIICGVNTLKFNWKKEIEKHSNLTCKILGETTNSKGVTKIGSVSDRLEQLKKPIKEFFVITNIETLRDNNIIKELVSNKHNIFDMIVVDEIHTTKNPSSQQGKNLLKLNKSKFLIGATGTLLLNNPLDLYVPLKWIGAEKACYSMFKYFYCRFGGPFNNALIGFKNLNILKDQLQKYSLRRTKDILNLPPKTIINEYVDLNDKHKLFYENIKQGIVNEVDKVVLNPSSVLGMVARLRQATACPSILTSENIESSKIARAVDLSEQILSCGDKVVIFSTFKQTCNVLFDKLKEYNPVICNGDIKDQIIDQNIEKFQNDSECKVMIATHQKMGTGVTLTASNYVIFIDTPYTDALYTQAQDRCYRIGSKNPVTIYNLVAKDTVDERVLEIVEDKKALSEYIVDNSITKSGLNSLVKWIEDLK